MPIEDDSSGYDKLIHELKELDNLAIEIGIFGDEDDPKQNMAMIASVHEFGCKIKMTDKMRKYLGAMGLFNDDDREPHQSGDGYIHIPERSFLRSAFDEKVNSWVRRFESDLEKLCNLELTAKQVYGKLGALIVGDIQKQMRDLRDPPLTKFTIEHRPNGGDNPLMDTGHLRERITWKVVRSDADV